MIYLNEYDITDMTCTASGEGTPIARAATATITNLRDWTDGHSDGWAYWLAPRRASNTLAEHLSAWRAVAQDTWEPEDITAEQYKRSLTPLKAFLTRHGVTHDSIIVLP